MASGGEQGAARVERMGDCAWNHALLADRPAARGAG
jgi:hypothetical protein